MSTMNRREVLRSLLTGAHTRIASILRPRGPERLSSEIDLTAIHGSPKSLRTYPTKSAGLDAASYGATRRVRRTSF